MDMWPAFTFDNSSIICFTKWRFDLPVIILFPPNYSEVMGLNPLETQQTTEKFAFVMQTDN